MKNKEKSSTMGLPELLILIIVLVALIGTMYFGLSIFFPTDKKQNASISFVVDTILPESNEAVLKLGAIEIVVNNYEGWVKNDTLVLIKK